MSCYFRLRNRLFASFYALFYFLMKVKNRFLSKTTKTRGKELKKNHTFQLPRLPRSPEQAEINGVNWIGLLRAENGIGQSQRNLIDAARTTDLDISCADLSYVCPARAKDTQWSNLSKNLVKGRKTIFHLNPPDVPSVIRCLGKKVFQLGPNIGYWAWELPDLPKSWLQSVETYSEVWTPSVFCANTFRKALTIPVRVVPISIRTPDEINNVSHMKRIRRELGLPPDGFLFGTIFDVNSTLSRKNPLGGVSAFKKAFTKEDNCYLVVKVNCSKKTQTLRKLARLFEDSKKYNIILINEVWDRERINAFLKCIDAYISLHRSEGFGMPIAEAMGFGKCVIATGWSGNMDFLDKTNGFPVEYSLVSIEEQDGPYEVGNQWADPDINHAAECMRICYQNQDYSEQLGIQAHRDIKKKYSPKIIGSILQKILTA